jgi:hypothetical protein
MVFLFIEEIDFRDEIKASSLLLMLATKNFFLASQMSIKTEPFQRTDISVQPLGFNLQLFRVQILNIFYRVPLGPPKIKKFKKRTRCLLVGSESEFKISEVFLQIPLGLCFLKIVVKADPAHVNSVRR